MSTQESFELFKKQKTEREERVSVSIVPSYATGLSVLMIKSAECTRILTKITNVHNEPLSVCTFRYKLGN